MLYYFLLTQLHYQNYTTVLLSFLWTSSNLMYMKYWSVNIEQRVIRVDITRSHVAWSSVESRSPATHGRESWRPSRRLYGRSHYAVSTTKHSRTTKTPPALQWYLCSRVFGQCRMCSWAMTGYTTMREWISLPTY